jgi:Icc-related predicted phosphoesterase
MRILHTSDFHGNLRWFHWLVKTAPGFDLVCLAGDLIDQHADGKSVAEQLAPIAASIRDFPVPIAICSGNHDQVGNNPYNLKWLERLRRPGVFVDGDVFLVQGWRVRCLGWAEPLPHAGPDEIWVTHAPPAGSAVALPRRATRCAGDAELGHLWRSESGCRFTLCGHVHEPTSWHDVRRQHAAFNPGYCSIAPFPNHIVIDLTKRFAERRRFLCVPETVALSKMARSYPKASALHATILRTYCQ